MKFGTTLETSRKRSKSTSVLEYAGEMADYQRVGSEITQEGQKDIYPYKNRVSKYHNEGLTKMM